MAGLIFAGHLRLTVFCGVGDKSTPTLESRRVTSDEGNASHGATLDEQPSDAA